MKVDLYDIYLSHIIYCLLFYSMAILIPFFCYERFVVSLSLRENSSESIGQKYFSWNSTRQQMNG